MRAAWGPILSTPHLRRWAFFGNNICSVTFVIVATMYPSAENQVCLEQLGEEISESWVSPTFPQHSSGCKEEEH